MDSSSTLLDLRDSLKARWPNILESRRISSRLLARLEKKVVLASIVPADTSLVVFGSLARRELTRKSDADWTLLVDGPAYSSHKDAAVQAEQVFLAERLSEPGAEGTFGGLAFSHDLVHYIGGGDDTNRNTTRRILLLLESAPVGPFLAYDRVFRQLLKRYVEEDFGWQHGHNVSNIPRFLQNDIARYWRTVAVDFAYKRRERQAKGWALRTFKLRLSRKLTYVAGLLACFSCAKLRMNRRISAEERTMIMVDHLETTLRRPALDTVAEALLDHSSKAAVRAAARQLFSAYDAFLAILNDRRRRRALDRLSPLNASTSKEYAEARRIGHRFQDALTTIFLGPPSTELTRLTRAYGVF